MGWQDISTAPRDGTWIIAVVCGEVQAIRWDDTEDDDMHTGWCGAGHEFGGVLYSLHYQLIAEPTAWQPFPSPPVEG